jgi:hypothetical protein
MKLLSVLAATLMLFASSSYADHDHEEGKSTEQMGHDKEHQHVKADKKDHEHVEAHHKPHDHKAHHPDHKDETKKQ